MSTAAGRLPGEVKSLVSMALAEDVGSGDVTSRLLVSAAAGTAEIIGRERLCFAGAGILRRVFREVDAGIEMEPLLAEGEAAEPGARLVLVRGPQRSILTAERTALNFLARISGVATLTRRYVEAVHGTRAQIVDTRKTLPGWRWLDKYAVRAGGGVNHRMGLYDEVLVKDNHVDTLGGMEAVVHLFRRARPPVPLAIECRSLDEVREALRLPPDLIMLDNMKADEVREIVGFVDGRVPLEATGGVDLSTVAELAAAGVDRISIGRLTHSAPAVDVSLQWLGGG
jgi:nicotinate-nucleotide pyrophosphorylase (carboxylating)